MLTWVINKITKVTEVVTLFTVGFFWLHDIVISLLGMSLLVFANDFVTMSIATDNVKSTNNPNIWNIKSITLSSLILGVFFALEDLFILYIGINYFKLEFDKLCTLMTLSLVFNTQFRILILREREHFWSSFPSKSLLLVNVITIMGFVALGVLGIFIASLQIGQVFVVLGISIIFAVCIDFIKSYLFKKMNV